MSAYPSLHQQSYSKLTWFLNFSPPWKSLVLSSSDKLVSNPDCCFLIILHYCAYCLLTYILHDFILLFINMLVPNYKSEVYGEGSICVEVNSTLGDCLPLGGTPRCYQRRVVKQRTTNQVAFAINVQGK